MLNERIQQLQRARRTVVVAQVRRVQAADLVADERLVVLASLKLSGESFPSGILEALRHEKSSLMGARHALLKAYDACALKLSLSLVPLGFCHREEPRVSQLGAGFFLFQRPTLSFEMG